MWWTPRDQSPQQVPPGSIDDLIASISNDEKLQFEPGANFQYSNTGFLVLGKVIEKVTGRSYEEYVRENIYKPAGLHATDPEAVDAAHGAAAIRYRKTFDLEGSPVFRATVVPDALRGGPHGGGYSTVGDLVKFARALRSGKLLRPENVQLLTTAKPKLGAPQYGYGFDINEMLGIAGHGGGADGISNNIDLFLSTGWTAVVLSNYTESSFEVCVPIVRRMRELVRASTPTH